jgi:4'-phosphopantetheinyl transferase
MEIAARRTGAARLHFKNRRGALRLILGRYLQEHPVSLEFRRGTNGKPCLTGGELDFNLSHSKNIVALAVARKSELGIDIEALRRIEHHNDIISRFFQTEERDRLAKTASTAFDEAFLRIWVRKEAALKAAGTGIVDGLSVKVPVQQELQGASIDLEDHGGRFYLYDLASGPRRVAPLATRHRVERIIKKTLCDRGFIESRLTTCTRQRSTQRRN